MIYIWYGQQNKDKMKQLFIGIMAIVFAVTACKKDKNEPVAPVNSTPPVIDPNAEQFNGHMLGTFIAVSDDGIAYTKDTFKIFQMGAHFYMECPLRIADADHDTTLLHMNGDHFAVPKDTINSVGNILEGSGILSGNDLALYLNGLTSYSPRHFTKQ